MQIKLIERAITTDDLLFLANSYCDSYKPNTDVKFRIADFLRYVESNRNTEIMRLVKLTKEKETE